MKILLPKNKFEKCLKNLDFRKEFVVSYKVNLYENLTSSKNLIQKKQIKTQR